MNNKQHEKKGKMSGALAAGVIAAGAAAAGYYFYGSEDAKKRRKIATQWATAVKKDVLKQLDRASKIDKTAVTAAVSKAVQSAKSMTGVNEKELQRLAKELKTHWNHLASEAHKTVRSTVKQAKKSGKKVAKKIQ